MSLEAKLHITAPPPPPPSRGSIPSALHGPVSNPPGIPIVTDPASLIAVDGAMRQSIPISPAVVRPSAGALDQISQKIPRIAAQLPDDLRSFVVSRLNTFATEQSADALRGVKDVLHFGLFNHGGTTFEQRLDIRTVLATQLAFGMPLEEVQAMRPRLIAMDAGNLRTLVATLGPTIPSESLIKLLGGAIDVPMTHQLNSGLAKFSNSIPLPPSTLLDDGPNFMFYTTNTGRLVAEEKSPYLVRPDFRMMAIEQQNRRLEGSTPGHLSTILEAMSGAYGTDLTSKDTAQLLIAKYQEFKDKPQLDRGALCFETADYAITTDLVGSPMVLSNDESRTPVIRRLFATINGLEARSGLTQSTSLLDAQAVTAQFNDSPIVQAELTSLASNSEVPKHVLLTQTPHFKVIADLSNDPPLITCVTNHIEYRPIGLPDRNQNLSADTITRIREMFTESVGQKYSHMSGALQIVHAARTSGLSLGDAKATLRPSHDAIAATGGGDCMDQALELKHALSEIGIDALPVGQITDNGIKLPSPDGTGKVVWPGGFEHCDRIGHIDLLIPYTDEGGILRALHLQTGMGTDPKFFKSYDSLETALVALKASKYNVDESGGEILNPELGILKKTAVRSTLFFHRTGDMSAEELMGIDLLNGTLFLNTNASAVSELPYLGPGTKPVKISLNFKDALAAPNDTVTATVIEGGSLVQKTLTNAQYVLLFVDKLCDEFAIPPDARDDLLHLMSNRIGYIQQVLLPPAETLIRAQTKREEVEARRAAIVDSLTEDQRIQLNKQVRKGHTAVAENRLLDALKIYQEICVKLPAAE